MHATHRSLDELRAGLDLVRAAPRDAGVVALVVCRPGVDERAVVERAELTPGDGVVGDTWRARGSRHTDDGSAEVARQVTIMSARAITLFAGAREHWPLAGDQLYVDLDLSEDRLPAGSWLRAGDALLEVSTAPHTGCAKFAARFGTAAARLVRTPEGRALRLRGLNASVREAGWVAVGDAVTPVRAGASVSAR